MALQEEQVSHQVAGQTHVIDSIPSCQGLSQGCAQSRVPAVQVCVGADGALLWTPFLAAGQCHGLLCITSLPVSQAELPGEGETVALKVGGMG